MSNAVVFHVLRREAAGRYDGFWYATPALAPGERVVIWSGLPPAGLSARLDGIAPIVVWGELDGRRVYVERIPRGLRLDEATALPHALRGYVAERLEIAVRGLHAAGRSHGVVAERHVVLGEGGEVVLMGRGRRGAGQEADLEGVLEIRAGVSDASGDRSALAAWVRDRLVDVEPSGRLVILADVDSMQVDEVVPDIGPDPDARGLLDRWSTTTSGGGEVTAEVTDTGRGTQQLAMQLWARVVGTAEAPTDRFVANDGRASRAIRSLVSELGSDPVPMSPAVGSGILQPSVGLSGPDTDGPTLHEMDQAELEDFDDPMDTAVGGVGGPEERENTVTETSVRRPKGLTLFVGVLVLLAFVWLALAL